MPRRIFSHFSASVAVAKCPMYNVYRLRSPAKLWPRKKLKRVSSGERGCGIVTGVATEHKVMTNFPAAAGVDSNRIANFPGNSQCADRALSLTHGMPVTSEHESLTNRTAL